MKVAKGKISRKKSGNRGYNSYWVYLPSKISKDKSFPFKDKEEITVELKDDTLIIRKIYNLREITKNFGVDDATLPNLIEKKALQNKHLPFLNFRDKSFSYLDTNKNSNQIAHGLLKLVENLKLSNPKIALLFPNCPEFIFCWFGIAKTGCVLVPISRFLEGELLEFVLKNSDTEILIIDYQYFPQYKKISSNLPEIKRVLIRNAPKGFKFDNKFLDFQEIISNNLENPNIAIKNFHPLEILYTQGTTGKPKGVLYRHYSILSGISVGRELEESGLSRKNKRLIRLVRNKIYCPLPLFTGGSRFMVIIPAMFYDASVTIAKFDAPTFWDDINKYKPHGICYFGSYLSELMNQKPEERDRKHSVKFAFGFGARKKIWEAFERRFGIPILEAWSLVEGVGMTINTIGSKGGKVGSVGRPVRGFELKILDPKGKELLPGRNNIGEIVSRTKLPFDLEYYNLPKEETTNIRKNRWVHTDDFGYKDKDGFIYFLGRHTDMIQKGGEPFFAIDIEMVANSHSLIVESAAFEVPNGESPSKAIKICAAIKDGATISHAELSNYLFQNMAYFMVPQFIEFKKELPKNDIGLIQKFLLRKEWENKHSRKNTYDTLTKNFVVID